MYYTGGKNGGGSFQQIINTIPPHSVYIECFFGSGAVYRNKKRAAVNIAVELDPAVIETILSSREYGQVILTDGEDVAALNRYCGDPYVDASMDVLHLVPWSALAFLDCWDWHGNEYVYCDPPYLFGSRRSQKKLYGCEFGAEAEHLELLSLLLALRAYGVNVGISGYQHPLYASMLPGWRTASWQVMTRGLKMATETLWMNYPEGPLHDYSYLGADYRERERIQRKVLRWQRRLLKMPELERLALIEAVANYSVAVPAAPEATVAPGGAASRQIAMEVE